jgi:hypothetical protein
MYNFWVCVMVTVVCHCACSSFILRLNIVPACVCPCYPLHSLLQAFWKELMLEYNLS